MFTFKRAPAFKTLVKAFKLDGVSFSTPVYNRVTLVVGIEMSCLGIEIFDLL